MAERIVKIWLIVNADGEVRVRKSLGRLAYNEVQFPVTITIPLRGMTAEEIRLYLPEMPMPTAEVGEVEEPEKPALPWSEPGAEPALDVVEAWQGAEAEEPKLGINLATGQLVPPETDG
jgi:hypothetical protein